MLDSSVVDVAERMITAQYIERREQLEHDIQSIRAQMSSRGMLHSGSTITKTRQRCVQEIEARMQIAWKVFWRVLTTTGTAETPRLGDDIKAAVSRVVEPAIGDIEAHLIKAQEIVGMRTETSLVGAYAHAASKVDAEIDLFVLSLRSNAGAGGGAGQTLNFYSPVGAVQTGAGSFAVVLSPSERETIRSALDQLLLAVANLDTVGGHSQEEYVEVVQEAKEEVQKGNPNKLRLSTLATSIATGIQTTASLQPAYSALKAALLPLGIVLP